MPKTAANGIEIEYEQFGPEQGTPLLLVMGLGAQMIQWDEDFIGLFVDRGFAVTRFDNRDVGLSTKLDEAGPANVIEVMTQARAGEVPEVAYTLDDMADDTAGLLDALQIDSTHVVGASMGGMIAQTLAIRYPRRVKSLVSIMSTTGEPELPGPSPEAMSILVGPPPQTREEAIERGVKLWSVIGSPGFPFDEERTRERAGRFYDRANHPEGQARQLAAIVSHGSRREALTRLDVPTLVIHGAADPLVPVAGGRDTAAAIPGAELLVVEGMGHDLPPGAWPTIVPAIERHTQAAG